jgi:hypothetical protein
VKVPIALIGTDLVLDSVGTPQNFRIDSTSAKLFQKITIVDRNLVLLPVAGFSGKRTITLTSTVGNIEKTIQIPLIILPEPAVKPTFTPNNSRLTTVAWNASPNATSYSMFINGKRSCSTTFSSCKISRIIGPKSDIVIVANGGDSTFSQKVSADFKSNAIVEVTRVLGASRIKKSLSAVDITELNKVVSLVKNEGFQTVVISQITRSKNTQALDDARILAMKKYVQDKVGNTKVNFEVVPASSRTTLNILSVKS